MLLQPPVLEDAYNLVQLLSRFLKLEQRENPLINNVYVDTRLNYLLYAVSLEKYSEKMEKLEYYWRFSLFNFAKI